MTASADNPDQRRRILADTHSRESWTYAAIVDLSLDLLLDPCR